MHWGWAYDGVNPRIPRNTGPECANYLTSYRRTLETIVIMTICCSMVRWGCKHLQPIPNTCYHRLKAIDGGKHEHNHSNKKSVNSKTTYVNEDEHNPAFKRFLLVLMTFILGLEVGFKFTSRTVIYILNPCHITTLMQVRINLKL
jgi:TMEM164 family